MEDGLSQAPHLVVVNLRTIEVVFDGRPDSRRWKDLMVHLVQHVPADVSAGFLRFHDLVAGEVHNGSTS